MAGHLGLQEFTHMWYVILYSGDWGSDGASPVPSLQWHTQPTRQPQWPPSSSRCQSESLLTFSVVILMYCIWRIVSVFAGLWCLSVRQNSDIYWTYFSPWVGSNWQLIQSPFCTF